MERRAFQVAHDYKHMDLARTSLVSRVCILGAKTFLVTKLRLWMKGSIVIYHFTVKVGMYQFVCIPAKNFDLLLEIQ